MVARLLGEIDECVNVGEIQFLISGLIPQGPACGCGKPVKECGFWNEIQKTIPIEVQGYVKRWIAKRRLSLILASFLGRYRSEQFQHFLPDLKAVNEEVARRAGCRVIVDCSKWPLHLFALTQIPDIELYVLHLVRDPQAVVWSWSRKKDYLMPRRSTSKTCVQWFFYNTWFERLGHRAHWYRRIRFEDFVERPREILKSIAEEIFEGPITLPFLDANRALVHEQHHLGGNPDKMKRGEIIIRGRPRNPLPLRTKALTLLLTFPFLRHFGYL